MPAKNPRLTITLDPSLHAQLRRLSELTGDSQGKIIADILEGSTAVFSRLIQVLEAAATAKDEIKGKAAEDLKHAQGRMEAQFGLILDDFDRGTAPLLAGVETVARRGRKSALACDAHSAVPASPTPISNRGVRSLTTAKKSSKARAK